MLNSAYESVSIETKKPFTLDNVKEVIEDYNRRYGDSVSIKDCEGSAIRATKPKKPFSLINLMEIRLKKSSGYKLLDGDLIIPGIRN